jgi:quercetin dioxygenase-like cupin family protein
MRRHPGLIHLSHDHHHGLVLARRMQRATEEGRGDAARAYSEFMAGHGSSHFREEEELLFPLIASHLAERPALLDQAVAEHIELRAAAVRFRRADGDVDLAAVKATGLLLAEHIRREERTIFALAQEVVPEPELAALALADVGSLEVADLTADSWAVASDDLNATLVAWPAGGGVPAHRNSERDVLLVVVAGGGSLRVDERAVELRPATAVVIPRGATRSMTAGADGLRYLSAHRRRSGLVAVAPPR